MSHRESKRILVLYPCRMEPRSMVRIPSAVFALTKSHPLVFPQMHPRSRAPIGVSSFTTASASTATLGSLLAAITGTTRAFIYIRFPVLHNLRFIASALTVWEQMGLSTIETLRSVVRFLGRMMPMLAHRKNPNVGSVQGVIYVVRQEDYVPDAPEGDRGVIYGRHSCAHLIDAFLI